MTTRGAAEHGASPADAVECAKLAALPSPPKSPLSYREQTRAVRAFHTGCETLRDAGGPVTRLALGPDWLIPPMVVVTSPRGAHDVLGRSDGHTDRMRTHDEMRHLVGANLFDLPNEPWLPRRRTLQPIFTKKQVRVFARDMAGAADMVAAGWRDGMTVDLDVECRRLTLRALGRSVLGLDLDEHSDALAGPIRVAVKYFTDRSVRPLRAPRWLPTPARRRARAASDQLHRLAADILRACRVDPTRDAPLVHALMTATDPDTGKALSDNEICDELVAFVNAGHDTTATTLTYALWALGHHRDMQDKVRAEVALVGDGELSADDAAGLHYTKQVLHEALRLCPPGSVNGRLATHDIEVDGHRVDAGTMLIVGVYALHRDPALWDRPLDFDPDRFSAENSAGRDRWQYLPFGAGPRSCIGDHFAMLEVTLALATLVRRCEFESLDSDFPMEVPFTTVAAAPIYARVRPR